MATKDDLPPYIALVFELLNETRNETKELIKTNSDLLAEIRHLKEENLLLKQQLNNSVAPNVNGAPRQIFFQPDDFKGDPSKFVPPADVEHLVIQYPSRLSGVRSVKFDTKRKKWQEVEPTTTTATTTTATTTTTPRPTTTTGTEADVRSALVYPSVGRCTYSAMYQTAFQGEMNTCELFRDSIIDYRSTGTIVYDGSTVFFDGIKCEGPQ
ncbi:unnamed protein product [Heligmosomoides polygyrus]|uniref:Uncharacterized protein n=1 Tax=Heligmosomoides polygyrus TaxID=6339 RepID=A0A3P8EU15_HELPZ|nr:unnamed protein product [Heligmosomoides polygyrus]